MAEAKFLSKLKTRDERAGDAGAAGPAARVHPRVVEELEPARAAPGGYVLMNPGPVQTSDAVKAALHVDVSHRDSDFTELLARLQERLTAIFGADPATHAVVLLAASGTGAAEAALSTLLPAGKKLLVVSNGAFGERLQEIAAVHGVASPPLTYAWGARIDLAEVEARLAADPGLAAVAYVHHETSMGVVNPVRALGELAARHGRLTFVDCVSSLGGEELDVVRDHVDVAVACSNKCLHSVSGLSFVCVRNSVWARVAADPPRSFYLDLRRYKEHWEALGQTPFTPAVAAAFALDVALTELLQEGLLARFEHYASLNELLRAGLAELGLEVVNDDERASRTVTCVRVPERITFGDLYREMKAHGFILYDGKGALSGRVFQVANMGALTRPHVHDFLSRLGEVLAERPAAESAEGTHG